MIQREEIAAGIVMIHADCREVLPAITADHVLCDPPYEDVFHKARKAVRRTDGARNFGRPGFGFGGIDDDRPLVARLMAEASQGWIAVFCLAEGVRAWRDALQEAGAKWDTPLAWIKPDATPRLNGQGAARGFECIATAWAGRGHRSWNGGGARGVLTYGREPGGSDHPTAKPVPLMGALVRLYSDAGQTVLDPFCGSGSTGLACIRNGRRFVGIEREQRWFDLACRRLEAETRRPRLPFEEVPRMRQARLPIGG